MADGGDGSANVEPAGDDVEQLRAERDELQGEVERMRAGRHRKMRAVTAVVAIVLAVVSFAGALPGAWARRTLRTPTRICRSSDRSRPTRRCRRRSPARSRPRSSPPSTSRPS